MASTEGGQMETVDQEKAKPKRPSGRPRTSRIHDMPEQIPDSPENVAAAILTTPPKREEYWKRRD